MKTLYLTARNHMDPSWLRCFEDHYYSAEKGGIVRPYSDIEELQIAEYLDNAEKYGVKYHLEQSLVVRKYLERNPDERERFARLVKEGLVELAGGGEAVIDVNLTRGESWVRNHLYSRLYYEREFGYAPRYAITPDIFGLASQLPQFFRQLGYDALIIFDRLFKDSRPLWRGLDGTCIVLDDKFLQRPQPELRTADCVKLPACPVCRGEGCEYCEGTGIEPDHVMVRPGKEPRQGDYWGDMTAAQMLDALLETEKDEYYVMITTEEPRIGDFLYAELGRECEKRGIELRFVGFEENHDIWCAGQVGKLRRGEFTEDDIDPRPDGNPAGSGCGSSRIAIKQANRELEHLLLEAETLAALNGAGDGYIYPAKKLGRLWNKMAFVQFHDCVTGTHCDASNDELKRQIREIRRGAEQIYSAAAKAFLARRGFDVPDGYYAAAVFNPTDAPEEFARLTLHAGTKTPGVEVFTAELDPVPAVGCSRTDTLDGTAFSLTVRASVPPLGYRVLLWRPTETSPEARPRREFRADEETKIENEYFTLSADGSGVLGLFSKTLGRRILGKDAACLALGYDIGSVWGRNEPESRFRILRPDRVTVERDDLSESLILSGEIGPAADNDRDVRRLRWTQELTLRRGEALLRCRTRLDFEGRDARVFAHFPPAFDCGGRLYAEVPFGTMERGQHRLENVLGLTDEWDSVGFAGLSDGQTSFAVLKGGLPGTRFRHGALQISLFRSVNCDMMTFAGAKDNGVHESEYAVAAWDGSFANGNASALGADFNRRGHTQAISAPASLPAVSPEGEKLCPVGALCDLTIKKPDSVRLSAIKRAEDGDGLVLRFWESAGRPGTLSLGGRRFTVSDPLERKTGESVTEYALRPFEILTVRCRAAAPGR